jgi:cytochrome P450
MPVTLSNSDFDHNIAVSRHEHLTKGRELRQGPPIVWSKSHGGVWYTSSYEVVAEILQDPVRFSNREGIKVPTFKGPVQTIPTHSDPPEHSHYKAALLSFLTPGKVRQHEDAIRRSIVEAMTAIVQRGGGDAVKDFADKIPARAMALIFGFPDEAVARFVNDFGELTNATTAGDPGRIKRAFQTCYSLLEEKYDETLLSPCGDDMTSALLRYNKDGRTFSKPECLGLLWSTAAGAVETTRHAIGHAVFHLGVDRQLRQRLIDDPSVIKGAVEELLRIESPAHVFGRVLASDTDMHGVHMKKGDRVLMNVGYANRDEQVFRHAETIDVDRPNKHLAFGRGIHSCVGMHLARMELRLAVEELLSLMPNYELIRPVPDPHIFSGIIWGYDTLHIRLPQA